MRDMPPKISVIIPTFNRADSISSALDSVLEQVPPPDEVIVVDDGSTDRTPEILSAYGNKIVALRQENAGPGAARNLGMQKATGDWLAFLDSDDVWLPGRLHSLLRDLVNVSPLVVGHTADIWLSGKSYKYSYFKMRGWSFPEGDYKIVERPLMYTLSGVFSQSTAIRSSAVSPFIAFSETLRLSEDSFFFSKLALTGKWMFTGDRVADVRRLEGDGIALSEVAKTNPTIAAETYIRMVQSLYPFMHESVDRRIAGKAISGYYLKLAFESQKKKRKSELGFLFKSIRYHPSKIKAATKVVLALIIRNRGYQMLLGSKSNFR